MGAGPERPRKTDWTAAVVAGLILGPVACAPLGFAFGLLAFDILVAVRLASETRALARFGEASLCAVGMGSGSMVGAFVAGPTAGWVCGRRVRAVMLGGMAAGLLSGIALAAAPRHDPLALFREPCTNIIFDAFLLSVAGGVGCVIGIATARALRRVMSRLRERP